jgi:hypothetical protein
LNLQSFQSGWFTATEACLCPTDADTRVARVGVEPTNRQGLSLAALPVCVPRRSVPDRIRTDDLHRDRVASTPGCSARFRSSGEASMFFRNRLRFRLPARLMSRFRLRRNRFSLRMTSTRQEEVVPDGIEPPFPGCKPGVVAAGPRDRDRVCERKPWDSNPQAAMGRHLFSKQGPHPVG